MKFTPAPLLSLALPAILAVAPVAADAFDPPSNYYSTATGTGATLQSQLHNIIDDHTFFFYSEARSILQVTDRDPNNPGRLLLAYDRTSLDTSGLSASGIPGWDSGVSWNREHVWARSRGVNDDLGDDNSDLHNLRPTDPQINSDRANFNFGGSFGQPFGLVNDGGTYWYPGDADAGMIARQSFYMDVRYDGSDSQTNNLNLVNGNPSSFGTTMGNLARMVQWHFAAPPDDFERRRNDVIHDDYQGNRNPFIDRPEFVWSVFVDQSNDSRVTIDGGTTTADPSESTLTLDFGRALVGSSVAASQQTVTLNKAGNDGTYFEVAVSGGATSDDEGRFNAFTTNGTDSATIAIGMAPDTTSPGLTTGTVTIDNLDITTAGGAGRGANDADDVITTQFTVLDHSNGSFDGVVDQNNLAIDFGQVTQGSTVAGISFDLFNLEAPSGFTADLDVDSATVLGSDKFDVAGLTGSIAAGQSIQPIATINTDDPGSVNATWLIRLSDEDLPGEVLQTLVLNLTGEVIAALLGDFNSNDALDAGDIDALFANLGGATDPYDLDNSGTVDQADADLWVSTLAGSGFGDADLDGDIDDTDLGLAIANFTGPGGVSQVSWAQGNTDGDNDIDDTDLGRAISNFTGPLPPASVPEPATVGILLLALACSGRRPASRR